MGDTCVSLLVLGWETAPMVGTAYYQTTGLGICMLVGFSAVD